MALVVLNTRHDMGLPFISGRSKRRDQIIAIDLGGRTTKAVHLQRRSSSFCLSSFAVLDAPIYEKNYSPEVLSEHLKNVHKALGGNRTKSVALAIGVSDAVFRQVEVPLMPIPEIRMMLKYNSKNYLQQDLPDYVFDCFYSASSLLKAVGKPGEAKPIGQQKQKVLVGGAKKQLIDDLQTAMRNAGLLGEQVVPGVVGPVNAFEIAEPELFAKEVVALVDIGFKNTSITILDSGEIKLNRVVAIGGDRLTGGLAESMSISYVEAENIKIGMPTEVQSNLEALVNPLGRELRASIDFFEHQEDKTVTQVFVSGGSAQNDLIMQTLQTDLIVPCKSWSPARVLQMGLEPQKMGEIEQAGGQLTVAIGAALSALN